eukprot:g5781.t1
MDVSTAPSDWFVPAVSSGLAGDVLQPLWLLIAAIGAILQGALLGVGAALRVLSLLVPEAVGHFCGPRCFRAVYQLYFSNGCGSCLHRIIVALSRGGNGRLRGAHLRVLRPARLCRRGGCGVPFATVWPVPLLEDNVAYLVVDHATGAAAAIDVCAAEPVLDLVKSLRVSALTLVLTTHRHHDHSGGNLDMREHAASQEGGGAELEVVASSEDVPGVTRVVSDGEHVDFGGCRFTAIATPTHTPEHVAWVLEPVPQRDGAGAEAGAVAEMGSGAGAGAGANAACVFSGDCLFVGGTGACFHGTQLDMVRSLAKLAAVPGPALLFPGHDYGRELLWRQAWAEPCNRAVVARAHWADRQAARGQPALPVALAGEREANAWLRVAAALAPGDAMARAALAELENALDARLAQWRAVPWWRKALLGRVPREYSHMRRPPAYAAAAAAGGGGDSDNEGDEGQGLAGVDSPSIQLCIEAEPVPAPETQHEHEHERTSTLLAMAGAPADDAAARVLEKLQKVHGLCGTVDLQARGFGGSEDRVFPHASEAHRGNGEAGPAAEEAALHVAAGARWQAGLAEVVVTEHHHYCVQRGRGAAADTF